MTEYKFDDDLQETVVYLKKRFGCKTNGEAIRKALALLLTVEKLTDEDNNILIIKKLNSENVIRIKLSN